VERALSQCDADVAIVVQAKPAVHGRRPLRVMVVRLGGPERFFFRTINEQASESRAERVQRWSHLLAEALGQQSTGAAPATAVVSAPEERSSSLPEPRAALTVRSEAIPASARRATPISATPEPPLAAGSDARPIRDHASSSDNGVVESKPATAERQRYQDLRLTGQLETSYRRFEDSQPNALGRTYRASPIPGFSIAAEAYPLAKGTVGFAALYGQSIGLHSTTQDGRLVDTTWNRVEGSAKLRFPTAARDNPPQVGAFAGYAYSGFSFDGQASAREVPSAAYHMARAGLDARVPIDRVVAIAGAEADWLFLIAPLGDVAARGGGVGVSAHLGFGYSLTRAFVVRADGRYASMFFGLRREGAASVVDQYLTLGLGVEANF
jgi:hypothetical protein